jgi:hypothetical protein
VKKKHRENLKGCNPNNRKVRDRCREKRCTPWRAEGSLGYGTAPSPSPWRSHRASWTAASGSHRRRPPPSPPPWRLPFSRLPSHLKHKQPLEHQTRERSARLWFGAWESRARGFIYSHAGAKLDGWGAMLISSGHNPSWVQLLVATRISTG